MASQKATGRPDQPEDAARWQHAGSHGAEDAAGTRSARADGGRQPDGRHRADAKRREPAREEWADEAAQARTSSDPRRVAPHDAAGVPSTGDTF